MTPGIRQRRKEVAKGAGCVDSCRGRDGCLRRLVRLAGEDGRVGIPGTADRAATGREKNVHCKGGGDV